MSGRPRGSAYMEWAKLHSAARFNLASSGVADYPLSALPASLADLDAGPMGGYGHPPLLERVAARAGTHPDAVAIAAGCSMANHLALAALVDPGDAVLIEEPAYGPIVDAALYLGADVRRFPRRAEDGYRLDPRAVEAALRPRTRAIVVTNPHNPSGALADAGALAALAELARGAGGRLVVDEVYRHALFAAAPPSAAVLGPSVVVTDSLTKAYGLSALRCGWVVGEPDLVRRIRRLDDLFGVAPAHPAVRLAVAAFDDLPRIAERARTLLERNTAALSALLTAQPDRLDAPPIGFGGLAFPGLRGAEVEAFCARLRERYETSVVPGRFFGAPDRFRIAVGGEPEMVAEGLARLATALREA